MMSAERFIVLVVNDEPLLHRIRHTSLRSSGFAVEEARTTEEALEVMKERTFDLALLYSNTPGANGVDLCRQGVSRKTRDNDAALAPSPAQV